MAEDQGKLTYIPCTKIKRGDDIFFSWNYYTLSPFILSVKDSVLDFTDVLLMPKTKDQQLNQ